MSFQRRCGICSVHLTPQACEKMSLPSIIRDWCEKLDQAAFEQLFTDGTDRCLALFRDVTNDEDAFIAKAAKMATDLRLEDWDEDVISMLAETWSSTQYC